MGKIKGCLGTTLSINSGDDVSRWPLARGQQRQKLVRELPKARLAHAFQSWLIVTKEEVFGQANGGAEKKENGETRYPLCMLVRFGGRNECGRLGVSVSVRSGVGFVSVA